MKKLLLRITSLILALSVMMTAASCSGSLIKKSNALLKLEFTEFPTKQYNADKVHPVRKSGVLTGSLLRSRENMCNMEFDHRKTRGDLYEYFR